MTGVPADAFTRLLEAFDRLEIPYMVAGSAASGVHGSVRMTRDLDLVARIGEETAEPLAAELERDFYVDAHQIREAVKRGRSFNVIHFQTAFKFDIFPLGSDPYQQVQFGWQATRNSTTTGPNSVDRSARRGRSPRRNGTTYSA